MARIEVEASAVEENGGAKTFAVAVATRSLLELLDLGVDALEGGVNGAEDDGIDDAPEMFAKRFADAHHRLETRA